MHLSLVKPEMAFRISAQFTARPISTTAVPASLSTPSFPLTPTCPLQMPPLKHKPSAILRHKVCSLLYEYFAFFCSRLLQDEVASLTPPLLTCAYLVHSICQCVRPFFASLIGTTVHGQSYCFKLNTASLWRQQTLPLLADNFRE